MHLADAFIQSDLHCIQVTVSTFLSALAFPGKVLRLTLFCYLVTLPEEDHSRDFAILSAYRSIHQQQQDNRDLGFPCVSWKPPAAGCVMSLGKPSCDWRMPVVSLMIKPVIECDQMMNPKFL